MLVVWTVPLFWCVAHFKLETVKWCYSCHFVRYLRMPVLVHITIRFSKISILYFFFSIIYFLHRRKKGWKKRRCRLPGVNPILKTLTEEEKEKSDDACEYLMFTRGCLSIHLHANKKRLVNVNANQKSSILYFHSVLPFDIYFFNSFDLAIWW